MKRKLLFMGLLSILLLVSACGNGQSSNDDNTQSNETPAFTEVYESVENAFIKELKKDSDLSEEEILQGYILIDLTETEGETSDADIFLEKLELDPTKLANGKVIGTMININADEIFVLEAQTEDDVADLKESLEKELAAQEQTWEQYLPDQHEKVKNNIIEIKDKFLLYATFSDSKKLSEAFNKPFES